MSINFSAGDDEPVDVLATAESTLIDATNELSRVINRIKAGNLQEAKATPGAVRDVNRALHALIVGTHDVRELCKKATGTFGATSLDFHAARDEIGRRLARLRDAGPG